MQREMIMTEMVQRLPDGYAIKLPASIMQAAGLSDQSVVEIFVRDGQIILSPAPPRYRLEDLLAQIDESNIHGEVDFGGPVGDEVW
jgi:antitoxin MazE